jgi:hypothetical protein
LHRGPGFGGTLRDAGGVSIPQALGKTFSERLLPRFDQRAGVIGVWRRTEFS